MNLHRSRRPRLAVVTAVRCGLCGLWVKPRYLRVPSCICRDCDKTNHHAIRPVPAPRALTMAGR
jgi:hypothetical protein